MPIPLDVRTLSFACGATNLSMAIGMTYVWIGRKTYPGFGAWTLSAWTAFAGIMLVAVRGLVPDFVSIVVANFFLAGTSLLVYIGLRAFTGGRPDLKSHGAYIVLFCLLLAYLTSVKPDLQVRLVLISLSVGTISLMSAWIAWKRIPEMLTDANPLVLATLLVVGLAYFVRALLSAMIPPPSEDFMVPSVVHGVSLLVYLLGHTLLVVGLLVLNAQRVERDLQLAMDECKVLQGILPICAHCKKIRDDRGAWNQLEAYIHQHTDAEFSHGICPDCARTYFQDGA